MHYYTIVIILVFFILVAVLLGKGEKMRDLLSTRFRTLGTHRNTGHNRNPVRSADDPGGHLLHQHHPRGLESRGWYRLSEWTVVM